MVLILVVERRAVNREMVHRGIMRNVQTDMG